MNIPCPWLHSWIAMKWGFYSELDARECRRCHRFQIIAYGYWHTVRREAFPDARPA